MTISKVQVLSVPVIDQDRARDFYVDALGFSILMDTPMGPDVRWVMLSPPGAATAITLVTGFETMPAGSLKGLVLETDDLDADAARLADHGVDIGTAEDAPWGRFIQFDDPDGNGLILQTTTWQG